MSGLCTHDLFTTNSENVGRKKINYILLHYKFMCWEIKEIENLRCPPRFTTLA